MPKKNIRDHSVASGRYAAQGIEAEFELGSRGRVLRNLCGIHSVQEMAQRESEALLVATGRIIDETGLEQTFTAADICRMHQLWLDALYPWAGQYRQVNVAKGDFMFAAAAQVPRLMREFEKGPLREFTPCRLQSIEDQAHALAVVHAELILIHPFREGNGRCARLLAVLMGLQAGLPALDFGGVRGAEKQRYIVGLQAALDDNYAPLTAVFKKIIARTLRAELRV